MFRDIGRPVLDTSDGSIVLPLDEKLMGIEKPTITLEGLEFSRKPEFHITLIGRRVGQALLEAQNRTGKTFNEVEALLNRDSWSMERKGKFVQLLKIKTEDSGDQIVNARSIIELVDVPEGEEFFSQLSAIVGVKITPPPFHVTIYTNADPKGIGLFSGEELKKYTEKEVLKFW